MKLPAWCLLWLLLAIIADAQGRRRRLTRREGSWQARQCRKNTRSSAAQASLSGPLKLQTFLDLKKGVVCFKVESCNRLPVCILEKSPQLKRRRLNVDCSLWQQLMSILSQAPNRRIEPVIVGELSKHVRRGSSYQSRRGWHDEIYSLCRSTIVYRLKPSPRNGTTATPPREDATPLVPTVRPSKRRGPRSLVGKAKRPFDLSPCLTGMNGTACERTCVGQSRFQRKPIGCSAFKIICTFPDSSGTQPKSRGTQPKSRGKGAKKNKAGRKAPRD